MLRKQKAIGLLELMLALAIIGTMVIAAVRYFGLASASADVTNAIKQIRAVSEAASRWGEANPNYLGVTMAKLSSGGYLPKGFADGKNMNPWGGDLTIAGATVDYQGSNFAITMTNVPDKLCTRLSTALASQATGKNSPRCIGGKGKSTFFIIL